MSMPWKMLYKITQKIQEGGKNLGGNYINVKSHYLNINIDTDKQRSENLSFCDMVRHFWHGDPDCDLAENEL